MSKKPMVVTKANITRVLKAAGFKQFQPFPFVPGFSTNATRDFVTDEPIVFADYLGHRCNTEKKLIMEAQYAESLSASFTVTRCEYDGVTGKRTCWAITQKTGGAL